MICFYSLSPALLSKIDSLSGCNGRWLVDCRAIEGDYSYALRSLSDQWPLDTEDGPRYWHGLTEVPSLFRLSSPEDAAQYCAATKWKAKLLFSPSLLNADCMWPGGYDASSLHRSNYRTFSDTYSQELLLADGDGEGLSLDVRFITAEMLEDILSLENYPLLSEDDHSYQESEDQQEAWENWAERDFRRALENRLCTVLEDEEEAETILESLSADSLSSLFHGLSNAIGEYWQEEHCSGWWMDCEKVAESLSEEEILSLARTAPGSPLTQLESLLASLGC